MDTDRRRALSLWDVGLVLAVVVLAALFVPESDDCYFVYWRYDSWTDFLLTRPVTGIIILICILVLLSPVYKPLLKKHNKEAAAK